MSEGYRYNNNTGSLFKNKYKKQPNHPDHTGKINVNGEMYELAAWNKFTANSDGSELGGFLSISIKKAEAKKPVQNNTQEKASTYKASPVWEDNETIPF